MSARQILMKKKPNFLAQLAFNRKGSSRTPTEDFTQVTEVVEEDPTIPLYDFVDNIVLEDFLRLDAAKQYKYRIKLDQFNDIAAMKLPHVQEGKNIIRYRADKSTKVGFWSKLLLTGSGQPMARENSTLMPSVENGMLILYLFGGSPMIPGLQKFEIFKINPQKRKWHKVIYDKPVIQTLGSRPLY